MKRNRNNGFLSNNGLGLNLFSDADLEAIHEASMDIFENTGLYVEGEAPLKIFRDAGAKVEGNIVKLPESLVIEALSKLPNTVYLYGRDDKHDIPLKKGRTYFTPGKQPPFIYDLETGEYRSSTLKDVGDCARLVDALDEFDLNDCLVVATDVHPEVQDFCNFAACAANTSKYVMTIPAMAKEKLELFIELPYAAAGGEKALKDRPFIIIGAGGISPLYLPENEAETTIFAAEHNLPTLGGSMVMAGGTGPVTLAGSLVVHNCETLFSIILGQLVRPGSPNIYASSLGMCNLKNANATVGSPEAALLNAASARLGDFYHMPTIVGGG